MRPQHPLHKSLSFPLMRESAVFSYLPSSQPRTFTRQPRHKIALLATAFCPLSSSPDGASESSPAHCHPERSSCSTARNGVEWVFKASRSDSAFSCRTVAQNLTSSAVEWATSPPNEIASHSVSTVSFPLMRESSFSVFYLLTC